MSFWAASQKKSVTLHDQGSGLFAVLIAVFTLGFSLIAVPLVGQQNLWAAVVATAAVAAISAALSFALFNSGAQPAAIQLLHRDYPGPERFRVADDPLLSGRPGPRAPTASCAA